MKTKALLFISLIALSLCTFEVQAVTPMSIAVIKSNTADPPPEYKIIELEGTLMLGVNPNTIVAGASEDAIYISFNQSFGNVNISIYNGMGGLVYNTVVNTDVQQVVIIPFTSAASGSYIVELSNANGYADGEFDKN